MQPGSSDFLPSVTGTVITPNNNNNNNNVELHQQTPASWSSSSKNAQMLEKKMNRQQKRSHHPARSSTKMLPASSGVPKQFDFVASPDLNEQIESKRRQQQQQQQQQQFPNQPPQQTTGAPVLDPKLAKYYQPFQSYLLNPPGKVLDAARKTHPKGFRYRVMTSPMERNMNSYFKLPTHPPKRMTEEFSQVHTVVGKYEKKRAVREMRRKKLDGFALLRAADTDDPAQAVEVTVAGGNFNEVAVDDLGYFTALRILDAGDNEGLSLTQFHSLPNVEELHLHCNNLSHIVPTDHFVMLHTLNVAFNRLTARDFVLIGATCPALQRLDFSHNCLGSFEFLRDDEEAAAISAAAAAGAGDNEGEDNDDGEEEENAGGRHRLSNNNNNNNNNTIKPTELGSVFPRLQQLALENNGIVDGTELFSVLSDLPRLEELNCNGNKIEVITLIPPAPSKNNNNQQHQQKVFVPFPSLVTLGIAQNEISSIEAIAALSRFPSLRRVILWGNPLSRQRRFESDLASVEFESIGVQAIMTEPGKMKRTKVGKFYNKDDCPFFAVEATEGSGLPRKKRKIPLSSGISHQQQQNDDMVGGLDNNQHQHQPRQEEDEIEMTIGEKQQQQQQQQQQQEDNNNGPSFFMTESAVGGGGGGGGGERHRTSSAPPGSSSGSNNNYSPSSSQHHQQSRTPVSLQLGNREQSGAAKDISASSSGFATLPSPYGMPLRNTSNVQKQQLSPLPRRSNTGEQQQQQREDPDLESSSPPSLQALLSTQLQEPTQSRYSAGATLRSVVSDLRRALRQPLPPMPQN